VPQACAAFHRRLRRRASRQKTPGAQQARKRLIRLHRKPAAARRQVLLAHLGETAGPCPWWQLRRVAWNPRRLDATRASPESPLGPCSASGQRLPAAAPCGGMCCLGCQHRAAPLLGQPTVEWCVRNRQGTRPGQWLQPAAAIPAHGRRLARTRCPMAIGGQCAGAPEESVARPAAPENAAELPLPAAPARKRPSCRPPAQRWGQRSIGLPEQGPRSR